MSQASTLAERTEKRLSKDPNTAKLYNEQFHELIDRGVLVEISEEELKSYKGPVAYVNPHEVYKPESASTPVRIVIDSSLKFQGLSPNDVWV